MKDCRKRRGYEVFLHHTVLEGPGSGYSRVLKVSVKRF